MKKNLSRVAVLASFMLAACGTETPSTETDQTKAGVGVDDEPAAGAPAAATPVAANATVESDDEADDAPSPAATAPAEPAPPPAVAAPAPAPAEPTPPAPTTGSPYTAPYTPGKTVTTTAPDDAILCKGCTFTYEQFATKQVSYLVTGTTTGGRQIAGQLGLKFASNGNAYGGYQSQEATGYASLLVVTKGSVYKILVRTSSGSGTDPDAGLYFEALEAKVAANGLDLEGTFRLPQTKETGTFLAKVTKIADATGFK